MQQAGPRPGQGGRCHPGTLHSVHQGYIFSSEVIVFLTPFPLYVESFFHPIVHQFELQHIVIFTFYNYNHYIQLQVNTLTSQLNQILSSPFLSLTLLIDDIQV